MERMTEPSVAAQDAKTDSAPWFSAAASAVRTALGSDGRPADGIALRDVHLGPRVRWASFDHEPSGDVIWAAQVDGAAPGGSVSIGTDVGDIGVWRYPNDPALPGLRDAVTEGGLTDVIAAVAPTVDTHVVHVVSLAPLQRAVVRVGQPGQAVFVKVVPPWRVDDVAGNHRRAGEAGLPVPHVLRTDSDRGIVVLSEMPGAPLAEHLENGLALPDPGDMWMMIERIAKAVGTHGDLHDRQLLVDHAGRIVGIVDLDDAGDGDLLDDLARLVAHIAARGSTHPEQGQRVASFVDEIVSTFSRHVDRDGLRRRTDVFAARLAEQRRANTRLLP